VSSIARVRVEPWAARLYALVVVLGTGGLLAATFALLTGVGRVGIERHRANEVTLAGITVSYPYANAAAIALVTLAAIGAIVLVTACSAAARHLTAHRRFLRHLRGLAPRPSGEVLVFDHDTPQAFCAGLVRPRIYLSRGALAALDDGALRAVIAHERHHCNRRDPLRLLLATVLSEALFFLPVMARLRDRFVSLLELAADEAAARDGRGGAGALAAAMLAFEEASSPAGAIGIAPERVDYLAGRPPAWRLPRAALALGALTVAAMLVGVWAAGQHAVVRTTLAVPGLSHQPCVLVLACVPGLVAVVVIAWLRAVNRRRA
jgi:BlaR1 peptidase M56